MTASAGFELREHTADVALYVWGDTPEALFRAAARGLYAALGELVAAGTAQRQPFDVTLTAPDQADLLGDFLSELLYVFVSRHAQLTDLEFLTLTDSCLRARGRLQPVDFERTEFDHEVKAVTRHNLAIEGGPGRWESTIILDI